MTFWDYALGAVATAAGFWVADRGYEYYKVHRAVSTQVRVRTEAAMRQNAGRTGG